MIQALKDAAVIVTAEMKADFKTYFDQSDYGGSLHFILDEGKLDTKTVERALRDANMEDDHEAVRLCRLLVRMTIAQRREVLGDYL